MAHEHFLRDENPEHYPHCHQPEQEGEMSLVRRVRVRPGRFPVGLDRDQRDLYPPRAKVKGTPLSVAAHVGRVEEVTGDGAVTVRTWARPSGGEDLTTLDARGGSFDREPVPGDLLWIWTWIDVWREQGEERREERVHVEVEHHALTEKDREELRAVIAMLQEEEG